MNRRGDPLRLEFRSDLALIEASAGTGKTFTLARLALRALLESYVDDVSQLLVVTFTNAAAAELHQRIRAQIREALDCFRGRREPGDEHLRTLLADHRSDGPRILRKALIEFDEICVSTIHGFCSRTLDIAAFESGVPFRTELVDEHRDSMHLAARDFWRNEVVGRDDLVSAVAASRKWSPEHFLRDYRTFVRYPNTSIEPTADALDDARALLVGADEAVRAAWSDSKLPALLDAATYVKSSSLGDLSAETAPGLLRAAESYCVDSDATNVAIIDRFSQKALKSRLGKRSKAEKAELAQILEDPFPQACERFVDACERLQHSLRVACIAEIAARLGSRNEHGRVLSYDDLLNRLHDALEDPRRAETVAGAVRARFRVALIDEFQDTDLKQYAIFSRLFDERPLIIVGDPKQAIYGFRGADVFAYLEARKHAKSTATLATNRRSTPHMIGAVNGLFARAARPFVLLEIEFEAVVPPPADESDTLAEIDGDDRKALCWFWPPEASSVGAARGAVADGVATEVAALLEGSAQLDRRDVRASDIAILTRKNSTARAMQAALSALGIPAVVSQADNIFASEEAADVHAVVAAIARPNDPSAVSAALATRIWGRDASAIHSTIADDDLFDAACEAFEQARVLWTHRGFAVAMESIFSEGRTEHRLLGSQSGERRMTNLRQLVELCHDAVQRNRYSPDDLRRWISNARDTEAGERTEEYEQQLESDEEAVRITTIHKSKGLEYEIVFCPDLWEAGRDPELVHADGVNVIMPCDDASKQEFKARAVAERLAEDARLLYVALTRSRRRCYVVAFPLNSESDSANKAFGNFMRSALAQILVAPADSNFDPDLGDVDWCARLLEFTTAGDRDWHDMIRRLVDAHPEFMHMNELPPPRSDAVNRPTDSRAVFSARSFHTNPDRLRYPARIASFSSIANAGTAPESEKPDHDAVPAMPAPVEPGVVEDVFAFEKGARAGTCLHDVFEHAQFDAWRNHDSADTEAPDERTRELIDNALARHGIPCTDGARRATATMLFHTLRSRLPGLDARLCDTGSGERLAEWQFYVPLDALRPAALAGVFEEHGRDRVATQYARRLATLEPYRIRGHLTGFVDLVFAIDDRWYVLDWKSNHLGDRLAGYHDDAVWRAMCDHDYVLQYHLYVVGLHRYLRERLPNYRYDEHFGGVYYAFLRGIREDGAPPDGGWYCDRPPSALIDALDTAISARRTA